MDRAPQATLDLFVRMGERFQAGEQLPRYGDTQHDAWCQTMFLGYFSKLAGDGPFAAAQTPSDTDALLSSVEFAKHYTKGRVVCIGPPSWDTYNSIMDRAGITDKACQCWDGKNRSFNLNSMLADLKAVSKYLIINLQWMPTAAHRLTGVALVKKQQSQTQDAYEKEKLVSRLNSTYQLVGGPVSFCVLW